MRSQFLKTKNTVRKIVSSVVLAGVVSLFPVIAAHAHQNPGGCNSNRFNISIIKDKTEVYQGQTLTYTVTASNVNFGSDIACDITAADIQITLPAQDGTPTGQVVHLVNNVNFPATTSVTVIGSAQYVVDVNPGVTDIVAEARAEGSLHDAPVDHAALIIKTLGTTVVAPPSTNTDSPGTPITTVSIPRLPNTGSKEN